MQSVDLIRRLHAHRAWCTANLRGAAADLSDEQRRTPFDVGQGSVWATLVHLYAAEYAWLEALEGNENPPLYKQDVFASWDELDTAWAALDERWQRYLDRLTDADLAQPVRKVSTSSGAGRPHVTAASDVLLHVCTHAQYTTAQAVNMLRQLGVTPLPQTMLITLARQEAAAAPR